MVDAALQTLAELGAQVEEVTIPTLHYAGAAQPAIMLSEAFAYHQRLLRSQPEEFGDMVRARFRIGGLLSSADYVQAQRVRNVLKREFAAVLQKVDVIVSPTMSSPAPAFATVDGMTTARRPSFTGPYNLTGMPAISVPCGFTAAGFPLGCKSPVSLLMNRRCCAWRMPISSTSGGSRSVRPCKRGLWFCATYKEEGTP